MNLIQSLKRLFSKAKAEPELKLSEEQKRLIARARRRLEKHPRLRKCPYPLVHRNALWRERMSVNPD